MASNANTSRTVLVVVILVILAALALRAVPFLFVPFGLFSGGIRAVKSATSNFYSGDPLGFIDGFGRGWGFAPLFGVALLIIWIAVLVWVYRDAERRGMNGFLWTLLVFIGNLVGLLIYLIIRNDRPQERPAAAPAAAASACAACGGSVAAGFVYCPACGASLRPVCPKCGKPSEPAWQVCPHCGEKLAK